MLRALYRLILRLYPAAVRHEHGAEMEAIFLHCIRTGEQRRARVLWPIVWMRGLTDALLFALSARRSAVPVRRRGALGRDVWWAVRGVRSRGWSAVLSVALMAVALASSTLVFSSADALIFNRVPYPEPDRLVSLPEMIRGEDFEDLRQQTDILSGIAAYQPSVTFLTGAAGLAQLDTAYVTPGLFETLGVTPGWGRSFVDDDRRSIDPTLAIIDASLARERFGSPAAALGQTLTTIDRTLTIVGVMPPGFRYPDGRVRIWRALDYERLHRTFPRMTLIARLAPGISSTVASEALAVRLPALVSQGASSVELVAPRNFELPPGVGPTSAPRTMALRILLGAALCLLLAACANVASLELAGGLRRARTCSIQMALGASRASLVRIACLEGACLLVVALALAAGLAVLGASVLTSFLPDTITLGGVNPIDVDWRALSFLVIVAAIAWLLASLPVVVYASRSSLLHVLKGDSQTASVSRGGSLVRRGITVAEVALAVMLLVGGLLYLRTYAALLGVDTGLDTHGVVSLRITMPLETFTPVERRQLTDRLVERIATLPQVLSVAPGSAPPDNAYTVGSAVEVDEGSSLQDEVSVTAYDVVPDFFRTVGVAATRGRLLNGDDPPSNVVITETFARYLWGAADPVGRSFRVEPFRPWSIVVGVVPHVRTHRDDLGGPSERAFIYFRPPPPVPQAQTPPVVSAPPAAVVNAPTGALYGGTTILVRLSEPSRTNDLLTLARSVEPRARYTVESLDASYASRHAETRMTTAVVSAFAAVAFLIAVAGVFGVMTFLVSSRTREIGIRMAIGADADRVRRMVLGSSLRVVLAGVALGVAFALGLSRFIESQLFGVTPTDPWTFAAVSAAVIFSATLASWPPARRAARVDPAVTLRSE